MRKVRSAIRGAVAAGAIALVCASCLDPTEITLEVTTDVRCEDTKGTTFTGGPNGETTERASPSTATDRCINGEVGTLVSTPSGDKDTGAAFVVVLGVDRPASECTAANNFKGCVVQRRALRYVKHKPITLPIKMWLVCKDVACDAKSTCARNGKCVPAQIDDAESCADSGCYPEGDKPGVPSAEAGAADAPADGADGGPITDGGPMKDADADAGIVVPPPPPPGTLYCPPVEAGCAQLTTCCWGRGGGGGHCGPPCSDAAPEIPMQCDRRSDCMNPSDYCCGTVMSTVSMNFSGGPSSNLVPDAAAEGGVGRTLSNTACNAFPSPSCGTVVCVTNGDCPPGSPTCHKDSDLWTPAGIFGECGP